MNVEGEKATTARTKDFHEGRFAIKIQRRRSGHWNHVVEHIGVLPNLGIRVPDLLILDLLSVPEANAESIYLTSCSSIVGSSIILEWVPNFHFPGSRVPILRPFHDPVTRETYPPSGTRVLDASTRTSISRARSLVLLVIGPGASEKLEMGTTPLVETMPLEGFSEYRAARPAGSIKDPKVSVPIDTGA